MASNKNLTSQKYADIRDSYEKWVAKKYKNVRIYTDAYIYLKLSERYYLAPSTIENIVWRRTNFDQLSLFSS